MSYSLRKTKDMSYSLRNMFEYGQYLLIGYEKMCLVSGDSGVCEKHRIEFNVGPP